MSSNINTSGIDATKPIQGNPTTQSVRDNFSQIKIALNTAASEITAAQNDITTIQNLLPILRAYDLPVLFSGKPASSEVICSILLPRAVTFPVNLVGSIGKVGTNPTASYSMTLEIKRSGVVQASGTISVATNGTFTFVLASQFTSQVGDEIVVTGAASADSTIDKISFTLVGSV